MEERIGIQCLGKVVFILSNLKRDSQKSESNRKNKALDSKADAIEVILEFSCIEFDFFNPGEVFIQKL